MSVPMPPRPPVQPPSVIESAFSSSSAPIYGEPRNASKLPMLMGIALALLSILIVIFAETNSWLQSDYRETMLHIFGYMLTPIGVVLCLAWDMVSQRQGMHDINFFPKLKYTKILRILTSVSFVIAWFHIEPIAKAIAESLAS
jgi:hypothetical protein